MKKLFALLLVFSVILSAVLTVAAEDEQGQLVKDKKVAFNLAGCNAAPKLDGVIGASEYTEIGPITDPMKSYATGTGITLATAKAIAYKLYMTYDSTYVYVAVDVTAPAANYHNDLAMATATNIWQQSGIQVGFAKNDSTEATKTDFLEVGYGRNSKTNEEISVAWKQATYGKAYTPNTNTSDYKIAYTNGHLIYEIRVPWTAFAAAAGKVGDKIRFAFVVAQGTAATPTVHTHSQFAAGITGAIGKDATSFAVLTLTAAPPVTTTAAPTTTKAAGTATTSAAKTNDASLIFISVLMMSGIAGAVVLRKKVR